MKLFFYLLSIYILPKIYLASNYIEINEIYKSDTKYFCSLVITQQVPKNKIIINKVKLNGIEIKKEDYFDAEVIQTKQIEIVLRRNEKINLYEFLCKSLEFELVTTDKSWTYKIQTPIIIIVNGALIFKQFKTGERKFELVLHCYFPIQNNGFHVYNNTRQNFTQNFKFDILEQFDNYFLLEVEVLEDFYEINLNAYLSSNFNRIISLQFHIVQSNEIVASKKGSLVNVLYVNNMIDLIQGS